MPACSHRDLVEDPLRSRRSLQEYERLMALPDTTIHPTAIVDAGARIGPGSRIWHWVHVCGGAVIGENCSLGQNVFVGNRVRSEEHTSELQSLMRISYAVFCLKKKKINNKKD